MTTKDQIREIVAEVLGVRASIIVDNTTVRELGGDSIDAVRIVDAVERELGIAIPDEALAGITTFGALAVIVEAEKQSAPSLERVKEGMIGKEAA